MIRARYGTKLTEKKKTKKLLNLLGLDDTLEKLARASGMQWYRYVLGMDDDGVLRKTSDFELVGKRGRGGP